jgi:putative endonuclease
MSEHNELGKRGESLAASYLQKKGFVIRRRNFVFDKAEVDIVAEKDGKLVFVEVKTRTSSYLSDPEQLVTPKKQKKIIKAADAYVKAEDLEIESRFDIVVIITNNNRTIFEHIEDAFYPTL